MDDDVGAVLERLEKNRSGDCIVHYQWDTMSMCSFGQRLNVADISSWISDRFAKDGFRFFVNQSLDRACAIALCEPTGDTLPGQNVRKKCVGRSVELRY